MRDAKRYTAYWVALVFAGIAAPFVALSILVARSIRGRFIAPAARWCGKRLKVVMREVERWQP